MLIYVWNLSPVTEEEYLRQTFEAFGQVSFAIISSTLFRNRYTGKPRGFGIVEMPDWAEARAALEALNRRELHGQQMIVYGSFEN